MPVASSTVPATETWIIGDVGLVEKNLRYYAPVCDDRLALFAASCGCAAISLPHERQTASAAGKAGPDCDIQVHISKDSALK